MVREVGDIAHIDKVYLCGPARWKETNPTGMSAGNELKFWTYIFIPKNVDPDKKYPLIVSRTVAYTLISIRITPISSVN
ncbi:hypothetical protein [Parabacteroides distasonis]|uniref:hypothetical protein n=1 Tax=Parabacteroides distasonis TaxID=823 RepID=UPI0021C5E175|nr:hypothetical protein [Parabacteroides distasonis]